MKERAKIPIITAFQKTEDMSHLKAFPTCLDSEHKKEYDCWAKLNIYIHSTIRSLPTADVFTIGFSFQNNLTKQTLNKTEDKKKKKKTKSIMAILFQNIQR